MAMINNGTTCSFPITVTGTTLLQLFLDHGYGLNGYTLSYSYIPSLIYFIMVN